jgi:Na+/H+ antiporter NhaD/arsenite permease-like protein
LLCLLVIAFTVIAVAWHDVWSIPLLAAATVLAILFAFHSRIGGSVGYGKASVPILPDDRQSFRKPPELSDLGP